MSESEIDMMCVFDAQNNMDTFCSVDIFKRSRCYDTKTIVVMLDVLELFSAALSAIVSPRRPSSWLLL